MKLIENDPQKVQLIISRDRCMDSQCNNIGMCNGFIYTVEAKAENKTRARTTCGKDVYSESDVELLNMFRKIMDDKNENI